MKRAALEKALKLFESDNYIAVSYTHLDVYKRQEYDLQRLAVKPGITGWWQVTERNSPGFDGLVRRDLEYIANRVVITDLKIVVLTVIEVITGKGAC